MKTFCYIFLLTFLLSCSTNSGDDITGKWKMYKVIKSGKDVSSEHNPQNERFIILKDDSTFESGGRPFGENTGRYIYDPDEKTLILDSDAGPEDDSQWRVTLQGDTMHWNGYGTAWAEEFEIIHLKEDE